MPLLALLLMFTQVIWGTAQVTALGNLKDSTDKVALLGDSDDTEIAAWGPEGQTQWGSATIAGANGAVIYIETSKGSCTGFIINTVEKLALTANHCDPEDGSPIWADKVRAEVKAKDSKKDLLVLRIEDLDPSRTALSLASKNPVTGQEVASVGFGYGLDSVQFRRTTVSSNAITLPNNVNPGPFVGINNSFTPGQSGGPVLNRQGNVVAIVQLGDEATLGLGVGAETIRERVGRFFGK